MGYESSSIENKNQGICVRLQKKSTKHLMYLMHFIRKNKTVSFIFRLIITFLFFIIVNKNISLTQIKLLAERVCVWQLTITIVLGIAGLYFQMLRWKEILYSQKFPSSVSIAFKTLLWGHLLAFITPGRFGELMRAWGLSDKKKICSVVSVLTDRFYSIIAILVFGIFAIAVHLYIFDTANVDKLKILIVFSSIILLLFLLLLKFYPTIFGHFKNGFLSVISKHIKGLEYVNSKRVFFYSIVSYILLILQTAIVLGMFGSTKFGINLIIASESYLFMLFFPFFIANIGLREYSFMFFLNEFSAFFPHLLIPATAFAISTVILLINIVFPAFIGLIWGISDRIGNKNIKYCLEISNRIKSLFL